MMEILYDIRDKAKEFSAKAVKKSGEFAETVKSKFNIVDKEAEISRLSKELGMIVYEAYKGGEGEYPTDQVAQKCAAIDGCIAQIQALKEKLGEINNVKQCPICKVDTDIDNKFCPKCGKEL